MRKVVDLLCTNGHEWPDVLVFDDKNPVCRECAAPTRVAWFGGRAPATMGLRTFTINGAEKTVPQIERECPPGYTPMVRGTPAWNKWKQGLRARADAMAQESGFSDVGEARAQFKSGGRKLDDLRAMGQENVNKVRESRGAPPVTTPLTTSSITVGG